MDADVPAFSRPFQTPRGTAVGRFVESVGRRGIEHGRCLRIDDCSSYVGPFNFGWQTLNSIDMEAFHAIINNPYHFAFGFWLRNLIGLPEWVIQTIQPYEFLAELLDDDTLIDMMPDKTKKGFRYLLGIEPYWKNETAVKCDLMFALLKTCWPVLEGFK
jgi:hypothetical protein